MGTSATSGKGEEASETSRELLDGTLMEWLDCVARLKPDRACSMSA